jgi:hypothetical protein
VHDATGGADFDQAAYREHDRTMMHALINTLDTDTPKSFYGRDNGDAPTTAL